MALEEPSGVAVLYNASEGLMKGEPQDMLAERGVVACAQAIADSLRESGYRVSMVALRGDVEIALAPYPPTQWVVFNLGEGLDGRLFEEARIAWVLEAMGYRFTGSGGDALARSTHKAQAKAILAASGVTTPPWWLFRHPDEVAGVTDEVVFPVIVKPVAEDASIGVGPDAIVHTGRALRERVGYVVERYRQAALAEVFVMGRELNVALWGDPPQPLPLAEIDFSAFTDPYACIVSYAAKWEEASFEYHHTPAICPARVDDRLGRRIVDVARRAWLAMGCRGYARVDIRIGDDRVPNVMEVNCNPDLSPEAGFYNTARAAGYSYADMAERILEIAETQYHAYDRVCLAQGQDTHSGDNRRRRRFQFHRDGLRRGALGRIPVHG
jgi:D-alanine-D-alanine ligase